MLCFTLRCLLHWNLSDMNRPHDLLSRPSCASHLRLGANGDDAFWTGTGSFLFVCSTETWTARVAPQMNFSFTSSSVPYNSLIFHTISASGNSGPRHVHGPVCSTHVHTFVYWEFPSLIWDFATWRSPSCSRTSSFTEPVKGRVSPRAPHDPFRAVMVAEPRTMLLCFCGWLWHVSSS